jgi:hypothetical protein
MKTRGLIGMGYRSARNDVVEDAQGHTENRGYEIDQDTVVLVIAYFTTHNRHMETGNSQLDKSKVAFPRHTCSASHSVPGTS